MHSKTFKCLIALKLMFNLISFASAEALRYKDSDHVEVYVNKVGPYWNPHETYHYYSLPLCRPNKIEHRSLTLGEVLDGDRMAKSMYDIKFKEPIDTAKLCTVELNQEQIEKLRSAIEDLYYFEFVVDDIPMRGFVGQLEEGNLIPHTHHTYLYTHYDFNFLYNKDRIIYANVSTKERAPSKLDDVTAPVELTFTYSVYWEKSNVTFEKRGQLVRSTGFFPKSLEYFYF